VTETPLTRSFEDGFTGERDRSCSNLYDESESLPSTETKETLHWKPCKESKAEAFDGILCEQSSSGTDVNKLCDNTVDTDYENDNTHLIR